MIIPLRDTNPTRTRPWATYGLIAANVLAFFYQVSLSQEQSVGLIERYGMVPHALTQARHPGSIITPLSSMFMHGGWMHLIFNMWTLYIFGDNVEDAMGRRRYLTFYTVCGVAAAAGQILVDPSSSVPMVGASGAIAGVLAAYMKLYPNARVLTAIFIVIVFLIRELPAKLFIGIWFAIQLMSGLGALASVGSGMGGVAFFAHIGGFIAGLWLVGSFVLRPARRLDRSFH